MTPDVSAATHESAQQAYPILPSIFAIVAEGVQRRQLGQEGLRNEMRAIEFNFDPHWTLPLHGLC